MGHTVFGQRRGLTSFKLLVMTLAAGVLLTGCSSSGSGGASVVDRNAAAPKRPPVTSGQYTVKPGDTLYSIAFRYGWDYKELAARNGIVAPYTIRPGQAIRFSSGSGSRTTVVSSPSSTSRTTVTRLPASSKPASSTTVTTTTTPVARTPRLPPRYPRPRSPPAAGRGRPTAW